MKIVQTKDIRAHNRLKILKYIRQHRNTSRAEISEKMRLNKATVSTIVKEWMDLHILRETQLGTSTGGRKPIMLELIPDAGYCIAIDFDVTKIRVIVTDLNNELRDNYVIPLVGTNFLENYKQLYQYLDRLISTQKPSPYGLIGIGISVRGVVDRDGTIRNIPRLKWSNIDIKTLVEDRYHVPVIVHNDGNLVALTELKQHPQYKELAIINITDVISTGLITNGKLVQGYHGFANALGHHTINCTETEQCTCGKYGCWEQYCSNDAVLKAMNCHLQKPISRIEEFIAMVRMKDPHAVAVLEQFARYLAVGIANIIFILNSEVIIINSVIVSSFPYLIPEILHNILLPITETQDILLSDMGADGPLLGASDLCIDGFFQALANS